MANEQFYLRFNNDVSPTNIPTDEFAGWDKAKLTIQQRADGFGRDEMFNATNAEYEPDSNHQFPKLLQADNQDGFEADVVQGIISEDGETTSEFQLDFGGSTTDQVNSIEFPLVQNNKLQLLKQRLKTKVNVFSDKTLDGENIEPINLLRVLFKAYPYMQLSEWKQSKSITLNAGGSRYASFFQSIQEYGIQDTLTPFQSFSNIGGFSAAVNLFEYIRAQNNLVDTLVTVNTDIDFEYRFSSGNSNSRASIKLWYFVHDEPYNTGDPIGPDDSDIVYTKELTGTTDQDFHLPEEITFTIPFIERGKLVSIFWAFDWDNGEGGIPEGTRWIFNSTAMTMLANSYAYNTVIPVPRLYHVMEYWCKSVAGLDIDAERFNEGGEFWDLVLGNGNLFRLKEDFKVTGEELLSGLKQFKADYELTPEMKVFFGIFEDFYRDVEIARLKDNRQFQNFKKTYNERFKCNEFRIKFDQYESQRENTQLNTEDEIHGEYEALFANKFVENTHEVNIGWVLSARTQERMIRAAIEEASTAATNNDDTLFLRDITTQGLDNTNAIAFTERAYLQHQYDEDTNTLYLRNDGSFSWIALGIGTTQPFVITTNPSQDNDGIYQVEAVEDGELTLTPTAASPDDNNDGARWTRFTYLIDTGTLDAITHTTEDGVTASGIYNPDKYPNKRLSLGQTIEKYHKSYLATINLHRKNDYLRTTFYKNNPNAIINGLREGGVVTTEYPDGGKELEGAILGTGLYTDITFFGNENTLSKWMQIAYDIRTIRGYITFEDNLGHLHRFFPKDAVWDNAEKMIVFNQGEEKYEPYIINIYRVDDNYIKVGSYDVTQLKYRFEGENLIVMDRENQRLYNPIFWNRVAVNGNVAESLNQLEEWLIQFS